MNIEFTVKADHNERRWPVVYKGNEFGIKALTTGSTAQTQLDAELRVNADELRTIWFALKEYADNLQKGLDRYKDEPFDVSNVEDRTFIHEQMSKVAAMMFGIAVNHDEPKLTLMTAFLDAS